MGTLSESLSEEWLGSLIRVCGVGGLQRWLYSIVKMMLNEKSCVTEWCHYEFSNG